MMSKTHLALGILLGLVIIDYLGPESPIIFAGVLVFASVLPDIDVPKSNVGKAFRPLSWIISLLFGHRGLMHTIFPPLIFGLVIWALGYMSVAVAFTAGYTLHLVADAITLQGLMPLFPLSKKRISCLIKTGGITEFIVLFLTILGIIHVMTPF